MNLKEARTALAGRLIFADARQIAAVRLLELAELRDELAAAAPVEAIACGECEGTGEVECICNCGHEHQTDCESCEGTGKLGAAMKAPATHTAAAIAADIEQLRKAAA